MKTYSAKPAEMVNQWIVIDAQGVVVGRLASFIAKRLRGKHRADYTPHVDCGDYIVVVNAEKAVFTGNKTRDKVYYRHTGHPGGIKETTPERLFSGRFPERVLQMAVLRMMPKESSLARQQMTKLRIYAGNVHPHEAQKPVEVDFKSMNDKNVRAA